MAAFICQQCKQPLQLDPSLTDLPQSAYDMVAGSLPKSPSTPTVQSHFRTSSSSASSSTLENQLSRLDIPDDAKSAIQRYPTNRRGEREQSPGTGSPRTTPMRIPAAPGESFVLLKDSVVNTLPSSPPGKRGAMPIDLRSGRRGSSGQQTPTKSSPSQASPLAQRSTSSNTTTTPSTLGPKPKRPSVNPSTSPRNTGSPEPPPTPSTPSLNPKSPMTEAPPPRVGSTHSKSSAVRLFSLLSSRTELDHPLCAECTHLMLEGLHRQLEETKKERDGYIAFEREVKKKLDKEGKDKEGGGGQEEKEAMKRIEKLKSEEIEATKQLREAEKEYEGLQEELAELEREEKALEEEEAEFWTQYSTLSTTTAKLSDQLTSLEHAHAFNSLELAKLSRTNVYNDAFCIGHEGGYGTINGLRLGKGPNVEWSEINAAWGMTVLLLSTIARKVGFVFESWRLVPMGSFSRIEKLGSDKASYELVSKDRIGEASIKLQLGQEETWTRALRHVLLALKLLLKWATNG
ncbi:autophagy protein 6 [Tulasnella sp. UAMH 9824]|nr:autophagy protein 6 [Tulasnella sp. UAMH 9824]